MNAQYLLLLTIFIIPAILSIRPGLINYRRFLKNYSSSQQKELETGVIVNEGYYSQFLDHFTGKLNGNFTQKYLYSEQFTTNKKIAFLFVADDANFERSVISDERNSLVKNAKQFGATTFALEHRYYGSSRPFDTYDSFNLRFLNSFQAIQDIVSFIKFANSQFKMDSDVKWVLWGVGYGGILAAEARVWDPKTITGVVASSTPLTRKMDFWEFNDEVEKAINEYDFGCGDSIKRGFEEIAYLMTTVSGRANISDIFQLNPRLDQTNLTYNDIQQFYQQIITPFQEVIQFDSEFGLSRADMCALTMNYTLYTPTQSIYKAWEYVNNVTYGGQMQLVTSYSDILAMLGNTSRDSPYLDDRLWLWQACREFGFFYTTNDRENGIFGAALSKSLFLNQCFDIFPDANLTAKDIQDLVENDDNFYGGAEKYSGTNVVFTYGEIDPWTRLGKVGSNDASVVVFTMYGASYAADMFPGDTNNTYVMTAHQLVAENINTWFVNPPNPVTKVNTTNPWTRPDFGSSVIRAQKYSETVESLFSTGPVSQSPKQMSHIKPKINKRVIMGRPPHGFRPAPNLGTKASTYPPGFEKGFFKQNVDHFMNSNPATFQQKYFKNSQWAQPGGPNFLMIGGEGPENGGWVLGEDVPYLIWAKKYGATVYLLEHRYYGDSVVGNNTDLYPFDSLQMLYDLAYFIKAINIKTGNTAPWITFGGSYSGALSAWMREVFPELVIGAVASSAPVFAKTDFFEYLMVVEDSIRAYDSTCADRIKYGFDKMNELFQTVEGRDILSTTFTLKPAFGDDVREIDKHYFFETIFSNFQLPVQYSGDNVEPYASGYGIPDICKIMLNDTNTPIQNVAKFNEFMTEFLTGDSFIQTDNKYEDMVEYLVNAQSYGPDDAAVRLWTYQTCREFGYFQTSDSGNGIFGSATPLNMYIKLCQDVFGDYFSRTEVDYQIYYTNYKYGSRFFYRGSNVMFPNGVIDPWHALGLYYPLNSTVVSFLINGTAHCADMYPARAEDVPDLKVVRDLIDTNIAKWLNQASVVVTTTTTPDNNNNVTVIATTQIPNSNMTTVTSGSSSATIIPVITTTKASSSINLLIIIAFSIIVQL